VTFSLGDHCSLDSGDSESHFASAIVSPVCYARLLRGERRGANRIEFSTRPEYVAGPHVPAAREGFDPIGPGRLRQVARRAAVGELAVADFLLVPLAVIPGSQCVRPNVGRLEVAPFRTIPE